MSDAAIEWWILTLYLAAALATFWRAIYFAEQEPAGTNPRTFWLSIAAGLTVFGANKLADLQTILLFSLKHLAFKLELANARQELKMIFLATICGFALAVTIGFLWYARKQFARQPGIMLGLACLSCYYVFRAATILRYPDWEAFWPSSWILEVSGTSLILFSAVRISLLQKKNLG